MNFSKNGHLDISVYIHAVSCLTVAVCPVDLERGHQFLVGAGGGEGAMDAAQRTWLRETLSSTTRPTFVGAHHRAQEVGIVPELVAAPTVYGYIFGHEHIWADGFLHDGYANSRTVQTATLPSGGFWGDIGYALFKTFPDRAELTVRQTDFWFNRRWPEKPRPKNWRERVRRHDGRTITFWYDKPPDFYKV